MMVRQRFVQVLLFTTVAVSAMSLSYAHSFCLDPEPYNQVWKTTSCRKEECKQACPSIWARGMKNSIDKPAKIWRRGQKVTLKWAKNNHRGGMMRVSIVPVHSMMSRTWQRTLAIYFGCWEQGQYRCRRGENCGSDSQREAFRRDNFMIPKIYPDGKYVLSINWYGGLHFSRKRGQFADYYSCSFIEIRGGPLEYSYQPFWDAGDTGKFRNGDKCQTSADWLGQCGNRGCPRRRAFWGVARPFRGGRMPRRITRADVIEAERYGERHKWKLVQPGKENGLCSGDICCPKSCGKCGGRNCNGRPGGGEKCCSNQIRRSGRRCDRDMPPCVIRS